MRLRNRTAELVVVPSIGRVMRFAGIGAANLLWENPDLWGQLAPAPEQRRNWLNFGGDKVWPAPQERWGWPPDPWLDGAPYRCAIRSDASVVISSPVSHGTSLRVVRTIRLDATRPRATIENVLENRGREPQSWSVWQVTQVDDPELVEVPLSAGMYAQGYQLFPDTADAGACVTTEEGRVRARRDSGRACKIGTDAAYTVVSCRKDGWWFTIRGPKRSEGTYPDGGCNVEVYSNPDPLPYMEMEVLGPVVPIPAGGQARLVTTWTLTRASTRESTLR